jgi:predicted nucleotidyltransferase
VTGITEPVVAPDQMEAYRRAFRERLQRALETREERRRLASQAVQDKAPAILAMYPSVQRAYLFGSVTRPGAFHPASDIDVALEGTTATEYFAVWRDLERALPGWTVDVREITDPSPFASLIRKTGVLIYERTNSATPD